MVLDVFQKTALKARLYLRSLLRGPRHWEEIEEHLMPGLIRPGTNSIDVGANTGSFTRRMALSSRQVHAIEPIPDLVKHLKHLKLSNVIVHEHVASASESEMELRIPENAGLASLGLGSLEHTALSPETRYRTLPVTSIMLDSFVGKNISFVKIDVEGHEMDVLRGAENLIKADRPSFLIEVEERHREGAVEDSITYMRTLGYKCFFCYQGHVRPAVEITPDLLDAESLSWKIPRVKMPYVNNFLFLPAERVDAILPQVQKCLSKASSRYFLTP